MAFPRNYDLIGCTGSYDIYVVITLYPLAASDCNVLNFSNELQLTTSPSTEATKASQLGVDSKDMSIRIATHLMHPMQTRYILYHLPHTL